MVMPPVELAGHLLDAWHDMGRHAYGGMGPVPLCDRDIRAWCENIGLSLSPWEVRAVKDMSRAYLAEQSAAEDPLHSPPFGALEDMYARDKLAARLGSALRVAARPPAKTAMKK